MDPSHDRTASLMTPAKLAQVAATARAPVSPAAFLDQMAADVGHAHVKRLAELALELEGHARASQAASVQPVLQRLRQALDPLDFTVLQPQGLWAKVTGKSRDAGAGFAGRIEQIEGVAKGFAGEAAAVQQQQTAPAAAAERALVELEVEYRALDKIIDQGARWLQDMRNQLKSRQGQAAADPAAQEQVRADAARCETLVVRLKALRAAATASQQAHQEVRATAERRAALMAQMPRAAATEIREWRSRLGTLASAAAEGKVAGLNLKGPQQIHEELRKRLDRLLAECDQLRQHEDALARLLAAMGEQLAAAA
ncbi:hypothetical protein PE066_08100 [Ramlibacter tataouinensis]|uniref:hypothetical protein n=1 Tax=Ramlibacter tataouinensis TaxID=94132 RepID=UPI0022F3ECD2|nr:hypothetical protein [Ramlibacter tataouinensis]WBY03483.1 hypothetical protein PE066_08100 [Ramlibacter tataouinensis]